MPTFAQPVELHGDPTSLSIGADLNSILLRIPLEIWLHIFDGEIQVTDLTHLRSISKTFWAVAEGLIPHVAARMHPSHANDPQINDSFFAEALIAAHRLNVQSPLDTLLRRDGSLDSAIQDANWLGSQQEPSSSTAPNADSTVTSAETKRATAHPTRADWIIGSRRMLHLAYAQGRPSKFGICRTCNSGDCRLCLSRSDTLMHFESREGEGRPATRASETLCSLAILGEDARFCRQCWAKDRECFVCRKIYCLADSKTRTQLKRTLRLGISIRPNLSLRRQCKDTRPLLCAMLQIHACLTDDDVGTIGRGVKSIPVDVPRTRDAHPRSHQARRRDGRGVAQS